MGAREQQEKRREAVEKMTRYYQDHGREIKGRPVSEREAREMAVKTAKRADLKDNS